MKTSRKAVHLLAGSIMTAVAIVAGAGAASAELCTIDAVPSATLLHQEPGTSCGNVLLTTGEHAEANNNQLWGDWFIVQDGR